MSDLFPDLENDIFISYRQNDNNNDGWVLQEVLDDGSCSVSPCILALASATLGKADDSIMYFRQAIDRHDPYIIGATFLFASNRTFLKPVLR